MSQQINLTPDIVAQLRGVAAEHPGRFPDLEKLVGEAESAPDPRLTWKHGNAPDRGCWHDIELSPIEPKYVRVGAMWGSQHLNAPALVALAIGLLDAAAALEGLPEERGEGAHSARAYRLGKSNLVELLQELNR